MADGSTTTDSPRVDPFSPEAIARLTGPAKSVALFVANGIARLRVEASGAVKAALDAARPEMDRMAREAAAGALAEAQAAKAAADAAVASAESMNAETRRMLDEIKKRQEAHDALFDSFDDLNGDGIPDSEQIVPEASFSTEIAVAPQMAPAVQDDARLEEMVQRVFDRVIEVLKVWKVEGGVVPVAIPANDEGGLSFREGSPAVVSGKKMRKILELAIRGDAGVAALEPMMFRIRDAFVAYMEERDDDLREALEATWENEAAFDPALEAEVERRLTVAEEEGLV